MNGYALDQNTCAIILLGLTLGGCGNLEGANLIFGQKHTVGLTIAAATTDQSAELTLGYKDQNFAIVPVAVRNNDGSIEHITSISTGPQDQPFEDALSVLGQFELKAGTTGSAGSDAAASGTGPNVGLGKFFATGLAARKLAQGFADEMCGRSGIGAACLTGMTTNADDDAGAATAADSGGGGGGE